MKYIQSVSIEMIYRCSYLELSIVRQSLVVQTLKSQQLGGQQQHLGPSLFPSVSMPR